ncbi:MAG: hypothetical protein ACK46I_08060 [Phycisphaerae bacterium]
MTVIKMQRSTQTAQKYHVGYFYEDTSSVDHRITSRPPWVQNCDMIISGEPWKATGVDIMTRSGVFTAHESFQLDLVKVKWRTYETRYVPDGDHRRAVATSFIQGFLDHSSSNLEAVLAAVDAAPVVTAPLPGISRPTDLVVAEVVTGLVLGAVIGVGIALVGWSLASLDGKAANQEKNNACRTQASGIYDVCTAGVRGRFVPGIQEAPQNNPDGTPNPDYWCFRDQMRCCFDNWTMNGSACDVALGYTPVAPVNDCNIVCQ